jgi:alkylmercury lyase
MILGQPALVDSTCPATDEAIRVELGPHAVVSVAPPETVVTQRHCADLVGDIRAQVCDHGHFFASPTAAASWSARYLDGELLSVMAAFDRCRATGEELGWLHTEAGRS